MLHLALVDVLVRDHQRELTGQANAARLARKLRRSRRNSSAAISPPTPAISLPRSEPDTGSDRPVAA